MAEQKGDDIEVRPRDLQIMRGLYESRLMKLTHISAIYFDGRPDAAKKRVQKLKRAGLIAERPRSVRSPSILSLSSRGLDTLIHKGLIGTYPSLSLAQMRKRASVSEQTLKHELQVMDVKAAVTSAIRKKSNLKLSHFSTWPLLNEFKAARPDGSIVPVQPDGFLLIHEVDAGQDLPPYTFFLEVDRGSENQDILAARAWCYRDYYHSGGFAIKNGGNRDRHEDFPFRVLFVFLSAERRNNSAERMLLLRNPIGTHSWLTTYDEVIADPLGRIWTTPRDYLHITKGTNYDPERRRNIVGYSRSAEREALIDSALQKHSILE